MIASARAFQNGFSRALGEWVCLPIDGSGSNGMCWRVRGMPRPYAKTGFVGARHASPYRSEHAFEEVT
jgi:hypothetical protein